MAHEPFTPDPETVDAIAFLLNARPLTGHTSGVIAPVCKHLSNVRASFWNT